MDQKFFGPRIPKRVLTKANRLHKSWIELNKAASTRPELSKWIWEGFDNGRQPADMAEEWEAYKRDNPQSKSPQEQELERRRVEHDKWIEEQKAKNKKS